MGTCRTPPHTKEIEMNWHWIVMGIVVLAILASAFAGINWFYGDEDDVDGS